MLAADHGRLLRNAVDWALPDGPGAIVSGPGLLDVTLWRQQNSIALHLVNLTNPMMMRGFVREPIAAPMQKVELTLPEGVRHTRVRLLEGGGSVVRASLRGSVLSFSVPTVSYHEVAAIDI